MKASQPIAKTVVLVGAGNAHLVFLKRWSMRPVPGVAVVLVNEAPSIAYSAMVPGHLAGDYSSDEITFDLVRLCARVGVRLVVEPVVRIDPLARRVHFAARPPLSYDVLSLGIGSLPACPTRFPSGDASLVMRPLAGLARRIDALDSDLTRSPRPFHLVVVGGGASGCELTLALHKRLGKRPGFLLTLLHAGERLLPNFPPSVSAVFEKSFRERGITYRVQSKVEKQDEGFLVTAGGERHAFDTVLWATQAAASPLLRESGLPVDDGGFLRVRDTLQSAGDAAVFGTGDCVAFVSYPDLQRNGVHAVRQGAVLFDNIIASVRERRLRPFRPQRSCMVLLNTADGQAVLNYGPLTLRGRWARRLKNAIDRAWMRKFTEFAPMKESKGEDGDEAMRCGGCGSKISGDVLSAVLKRLDIADDPRILMGCRTGEDAAVHRVRPELFGADPERLLEVQTVDYFRAFVDDPYLFGRIAALHAVSDLHAMNARPFSALAIATLPYARGPIQESQLYELLSGAVETFRREGVVLTGGHTAEGSELAVGFSVTGFGEEHRLFQKGRLQPGDVLILTKPLGSGALLAAWMRGQCRAGWFQRLLAGLLQSNGPAAQLLANSGVVACTDVTGFGLAGHLLEMLDASRVSARLGQAGVPLYPGFAEVAAQGTLSSLQRDNAKVSWRVRGVEPLPAWLFDPQTSGGLLAGVRAETAPALVQQLHQAGYVETAIVGEVTALEAGQAAELVLAAPAQ
jgi:selenide,water dikinase